MRSLPYSLPTVPLASLAPAAVICALGAPVAAQTWSLTRIADTATPIPFGSGAFSGFGVPAVSGTNVAFYGWGPNGQAGIYARIGGGLRLIADTATPIPRALGRFEEFGEPSIEGSIVAFTGLGPILSPGSAGVYTYLSGRLQVVADTGTLMPAWDFLALWADLFGNPYLSGGRVVFWADGPAPFLCIGRPDREGVAPVVVADWTTLPGYEDPCDGNAFPVFTGPGDPSCSGATSAFREGAEIYLSDGLFTPEPADCPDPQNPGEFLPTDPELYLAIPGPLVGDATPIPNGSGSFVDFGDPALADGSVAFRGFGSAQEGIYVKNVAGGAPVRVADRATPIPGLAGTFLGFADPSSDDGRVAFYGWAASGRGIYSNVGGTLRKVLAAGSVIDGRIVANLDLGRQALSGSSVVISVLFTNNTRGVYIATLNGSSSGCDADFNGDGAANVQDLLAFLSAYHDGDARADLTLDGTVDITDFLAFVGAYSAGCA